MTKFEPDIMLWLSDSRGIYIPRDFANSFADRAKNVLCVCDEDWEALEAGPEHDEYWEAWQNVLNEALVTDENGVRYSVYQDGDCWLIPLGMEWNEKNETFEWPKED